MSTGPKWSRTSLDVINNTYVVRNGLLYEYYPISVKPYNDTDNFIRLDTSPSVMVSGIAIVGKQLYEVSLTDLLRRRINVSRKYRSQTDVNVESKLPTKKAKDSNRVKSNPDEQGLSKILGSQVSKDADMAWENQVESLLETVFAKEGEEFEITSNTQSRPINEDSSVSDIFEDIKLD